MLQLEILVWYDMMICEIHAEGFIIAILSMWWIISTRSLVGLLVTSRKRSIWDIGVS